METGVATKSEEVGKEGDDEETCPLCTPHAKPLRKEDWVMCEACNTWYHWRCAGDGEDVKRVEKWYCKQCLEQDSTRSITYKAPARKSLRKRPVQDYASLDGGANTDPKRFLKQLENKRLKPSPFRKMKGEEVNLEWLEDESAMTEPVVIEVPEGLGMKMPESEWSADDIASELGEGMPVEVMDCATQSNSPGWTLGRWADYMEASPSDRLKSGKWGKGGVYNVISLEVSGTKVGEMVLPPKIVRDLDWVEKFWPSTRKGRGHVYPKVQLYSLMGVEGAWTDWHIDFAGSSVYYHILSGSKVFYFVRPTPANLDAYQRWSGSELQNQTWLGDMADAVYRVELTAGNTMIIPAGWIHAVYTPVDTMVFGGNFLHSYNVATQVRVRNIEIATQVPKKFRFPMFSRLCWYVADKYLKDFRSSTDFPRREIEGTLALADFLVSEVRILENGNEQAKKEVKEQIPVDRVKDAPALARELRWRARLALEYPSDDESEGKGKERERSKSGSSAMKRKRSEEETPVAAMVFKNFRPKKWDGSAQVTEGEQTKRVRTSGPKPGEGDWASAWLENAVVDEEANSGPLVRTRKERYTRVRKTERGMERQVIERRIETWEWDSE
ncbi:Clavaminate synthase-like protein [Coprinellus micaceus]|uniref:JmjC domain-containing histone demethylation protein 1 n=1 Tax=Coprinellus micaceus TaxID=71717 RepID=A0A4Y7TPE0_COPMI|nr:Clavaminate synthase-like protein [Coprinellus micaceus]